MAAVDANPNSRRCAQCGSTFRCGANDRDPCWCASLPPLAAERLIAGAACVCEACLRRRLMQPKDIER